jgi:hypothetical protein
MNARALPAADLSGAFAPPNRAAGIKPPPRRAARSGSAAPERPESVPAGPEAAPAPQGPQIADSPEVAVTAPDAPKSRATKKAGKRTASEAQPAQQPAGSPAHSAPTSVDEAPEAPAEDSRPASRKAPAAKRTPVARESSEPGRLVLWTTVAIRSRMKALQADTERVYRDQVLDALEATHRQLPELLKRTSTSTTTKVHGELFERVETATSSANSDERKQLTIRGFLESQLDVIDHLVASTGANSRSALINAALDAYLPQR